MIKKFYKGLKVRHISSILMIVCSLLTIAVFGTTIKIRQMHENLTGLTNDYINSNLAIIDLKKDSGKLTYYAICYLNTGDLDYLSRYNYLLTKDIGKSNISNIIELSHSNDAIDINTKLALREAEELIEIEIDALGFMASANGRETFLNRSVKDYLSPEELQLSKEEKINTARGMIFGDLHMRSRDLISEYTEVAAGSLLNIYRSQEAICNKKIHNFVMLQLCLVIALLVLFVAFNIILVLFIFIPLHNHLIAIKNNDKMKVQGAYEVRYIATAYNAVADKNALDASALKHKAEHDPLTGLINREAFDHIISVLSASKEPVAYLIIDIDLFKSINDKYGHPVGDKVLIKIAHLLTEQFRATDYVGRIGGDEFAVIMTKFGTASIIDIVRRKIDGLNKMLQEEDKDGLPPVSLSVGVALSDMGFKTVLIENADKALYRVKRGGRCNCFFYGAE